MGTRHAPGPDGERAEATDPVETGDLAEQRRPQCVALAAGERPAAKRLLGFRKNVCERRLLLYFAAVRT
ncbi:hypothetical protein ACQPYK_01015 [Streptosporangium sp. CA-135522]|uniref:hypothetical protein n=1 Tax=Streptosporangium sp. CA-135522 TaxID=3240072 RepID=UPI003D8BE775